jgi:hypothetical protein
MSEETKRGYFKANTTYTTEDNRQYADYWASYSARTGLMPSEAIDAVVFMSNVAYENDQSLKFPDEPHILFEVLAESYIANDPTALRLIEAVRGEQKIDHTYKKLIGHKANIFQEHTGESYYDAMSRHLEKHERGDDLEEDEPDYDAYYTFWKPFTEKAKALPLAKRLEQKRSQIIEEGAEAFKLWFAKHGSKAQASQKTIEAISAAEFSFHTSQEFNALSLAQCDGKTFTSYMMNEQAGAIIHERAGSPHRIRMELTDDERAAGLALGYLESLARAQDADAVLATAYILGVLAPPPHLPPRPYAGGWINFDDVLNKIGWIPRNTKDRRDLHGKIWNFVKFGERAQIIGKRSGAKYKDAEGNEIDTTIHGAAWRVMKTETPDPPALYAALETPVRAEIVVSKELTALISHPKTAQYFQCANVVSAIPGGKPAGAWARVIGLALMSFWRRKPREFAAGSLKPTRRELLSHFAAKIAPYDEILASDNPRRAIDYWHGALQILADEGFIERTGEAAITPKEMRDGLPRKNWQAGWLDQSINIEVGAKTKPAFEIVLNALPALKARDLKKKPRAKKKPKS